MPMLETDSIEVLSMRQDIIYAIGMRQWKKAQNILEQLKTKIGAEDYKEPQIQQEIQFIEAMYELEANRITACEAEKEYYEGTIDPQNGSDWNQAAPIDTKPTLADFKKTVSDYLAWEVSNILKKQSSDEEDGLGK